MFRKTKRFGVSRKKDCKLIANYFLALFDFVKTLW